MADELNAAATATPSTGVNPVATPAPSGIPEGHITVAEADWKAAQRWKEQLAGARPFMEAAHKFGLKKPGDLEQWGPAVQTFVQRGFTPDRLAQAFAAEVDANEPADPGAGASDFDPQKFKAQIMEDMKRERAAELAEFEHRSMTQAEEKQIEALVNELTSDIDGDDWTKALIGKGLRYEALMAQEPYADDHPLKGRFRPHNDESLSKFKATQAEARAKAKAASMANIGKAAATSKAPTAPTAGKAGGQETGNNGQPKKPLWQQTPEEQTAYLRRQKAGNPRANAGGAIGG